MYSEKEKAAAAAEFEALQRVDRLTSEQAARLVELRRALGVGVLSDAAAKHKEQKEAAAGGLYKIDQGLKHARRAVAMFEREIMEQEKDPQTLAAMAAAFSVEQIGKGGTSTSETRALYEYTRTNQNAAAAVMLLKIKNNLKTIERGLNQTAENYLNFFS